MQTPNMQQIRKGLLQHAVQLEKEAKQVRTAAHYLSVGQTDTEVKTRVMSAAAKKRISDAQKARWARWHKANRK